MSQQQEQHRLEVTATFTTSRTRSAIVAPITSLLFLGLVPRDLDYGQYPGAKLFVNFLCLTCLIFAVRAWRVVLRRKTELQLTPGGLTVRRSEAELSVPWAAVGQIRIDWDKNRPWVVAWLDSTITPDQVPASRRPDGSYRLFEIGQGRSTGKRVRDVERIRAAIMGYGGRYLDPL